MLPPRSLSTGYSKNIGSFLRESRMRRRWRCLQINVREPIRREENRRMEEIFLLRQDSMENAIIATNTEDQCWVKHPELKPEKSRRDERSEKPRFAMMATVMTPVVPKRQSGPHIWFTDSGASDHFSPHRDLF